LELLDECGGADTEGVGCFGERGVGHGDGEAVESLGAYPAGEGQPIERQGGSTVTVLVEE